MVLYSATLPTNEMQKVPVLQGFSLHLTRRHAVALHATPAPVILRDGALGRQQCSLYRAGIVGVFHLPACITAARSAPAATRSWLIPTRAECPEIIVESMPARVAISFRRRAISPASRGDGFATPFFRIALNTGPVASPAQSSQDRKAAAVLGDSQRTAPAPS